MNFSKYSFLPVVANGNFRGKKVKVKVSPLQAMKAHGGCGCKGPHLHNHGTRKR